MLLSHFPYEKLHFLALAEGLNCAPKSVMPLWGEAAVLASPYLRKRFHARGHMGGFRASLVGLASRAIIPVQVAEHRVQVEERHHVELAEVHVAIPKCCGHSARLLWVAWLPVGATLSVLSRWLKNNQVTLV